MKFHKYSLTPIKKSKKNTLSVKQKEFNRTLSKERIFIENIIAKIKVFKCVSNTYLNRLKRFNLRISLICAIINFEHGF